MIALTRNKESFDGCMELMKERFPEELRRFAALVQAFSIPVRFVLNMPENRVLITDEEWMSSLNYQPVQPKLWIMLPPEPEVKAP